LIGRRAKAAGGSLLFLVLVPGIVAGVIPWLLTGWEREADFADWLPLRILGVALIVLGAIVLLEAFARFVLEGLGTPAPVAPTEQLVEQVAEAHRLIEERQTFGKGRAEALRVGDQPVAHAPDVGGHSASVGRASERSAMSFRWASSGTSSHKARPLCEHPFVTSQGLGRGNVTEALSAAGELQFVGLAEALERTLLLADGEDARYEHAALRWHARFV